MTWAEAQAIEAAWWKATPARQAEVAEGHAWIREALDIHPESVRGASVTDLGGGPIPIVGAADLPLTTRIVVDPLLVKGWPVQAVERVVSCAEEYEGRPTDEVWGYNVLQHVRDPEAVLAVARAHAIKRVRWLEFIGTEIAPHHPHSIADTWLLDQFSGWDVWRHVQGTYQGVRYMAIVADWLA